MIETSHLFPILDRKLIELLRTLSPEDWNRRTIARLWTVKDIAAHLLDGNLRMLSLSRDRHSFQPDTKIDSYHSLVDFLNRLNAEWVTAAKRFSPQVLIGLLDITGPQYSGYVASLDPYADAIFSVAWAGEQVSKNWFHIAREYTEKWHHQQQIREATKKEDLMTKELFYPVMDTFMRGLPHLYRDTIANTGSVIQVIVDSEIGGKWNLVRVDGCWELGLAHNDNKVVASIQIQPNTAWKLFTKGISPDEAMKYVSITGNAALAKPVLTLVAVMA